MEEYSFIIFSKVFHPFASLKDGVSSAGPEGVPAINVPGPNYFITNSSTILINQNQASLSCLPDQTKLWPMRKP